MTEEEKARVKERRKKAHDFIVDVYGFLDAEPKMKKMLCLMGSVEGGEKGVEEIKKRLEENTARREMLDILMSGLDKNEKRVIVGFFSEKLCAEDLSVDLSCERSEIYRIKDRALDKVGAYIGA